ncbi:hypothetical protein FB451DRAFT_1161686 [Mycena latifolia]|nr:hypothetical protein FB451DRAFT_1161686 [Mycena latifolia]
MPNHTQECVEEALSAPPSHHDLAGSVYILRVDQVDGSSVHKIGRSDNPPRREGEWQNQCHLDCVELIWDVPTDHATKLGYLPGTFRTTRPPQIQVIGRVGHTSTVPVLWASTPRKIRSGHYWRAGGGQNRDIVASRKDDRTGRVGTYPECFISCFSCVADRQNLRVKSEPRRGKTPARRRETGVGEVYRYVAREGAALD